MKTLTGKQLKWAMYFVETGNATEAAIKAGYSSSRAKQMGWVNQNHPDVMAEVDRLMADLKKKSIATADEVLQFLTKVLRGDETEEVIMVADGVLSSGFKEVSPKDKLKAAELLGKRHGLFSDKVQLSGGASLEVHIDYGDDNSSSE